MLTSLFNLFIIICLLYVFYRVVGQYILPNLSRRRLERYKQKFFEENQHISSEKYEAKRKDDERSSIIEKRKNFWNNPDRGARAEKEHWRG